MQFKFVLIALCGALSLVPAFAATEAARPAPTAAMATVANLPLSFEINQGQTAAGFGFVGTSATASVYLNAAGALLALPARDGRTAVELSLAFAGADSHAVGRAEEKIPGFTQSYFIGNNPAKWVQGLSKYAKVRYENVWPGIGVVYSGTKRQFEYDFIVAPGQDPSRIRLRISGADSLALNANGALELRTSAGLVTQPIPEIYQDIAGRRHKVDGHYVLTGHDVRFAIAKYDRSQPLVIDPTLLYSIAGLPVSFNGNGVAVDASLATYVVGDTISLMQSNGSSRTTAFLYKVTNDGTVVGFSFGGIQGDTSGRAVAVDSSGNVYMTGSTNANDLLASGFQPALADPSGSGLTDAYVVKFSPPSGSSGLSTALYSSFIGGAGNDVGNAIAVDSTGKIYVAGTTSAHNFPVTAGSQSFRAAGSMAFLTKVDPSFPGSGDQRSLVYSILIGGTGSETGTGVAVDPSLNVYVVGSTTSNSSTFLPVSATGYNTLKTTANPDGFLVKLNASAAAVYYTTYPFGPINAVALDSANNAYVTGQTNGSIPTNSTVSGYQLSGGAGHAFLAKFNTTVSGVTSLLYASYLGGSGSDNGTGVATDGNRTAYVVGNTNSVNFPVLGAIQPGYGGGASDAFLSLLDTGVGGTSSLKSSTYLGGSGSDVAGGVAVDIYQNPSIAGGTTSPNFPVPPGVSPDTRSTPRAFATKVAFEAPPVGFIDSPTNGATNQAGEINFTGWAVSTITVAKVALCREPVTGEAAGVLDPHCLLKSSPTGLVYLGDAVLVPGVRPDVAAAFPGYPHNDWGWGAQVLTNFLPNSNGNGGRGNGTYRLHAIAADPEGLTTDLGTTTITANNAGSVLPFGNIDTPAQGSTVSGTVVNFGWALTPQPNIIPTDGSTITVYIDNVAVGHLTAYNSFRSDIATLFPGYRNSNGAVGSFTFNSATLSNGRHAIAWVAVDNAGNTGALSSHTFFVQN